MDEVVEVEVEETVRRSGSRGLNVGEEGGCGRGGRCDPEGILLL